MTLPLPPQIRVLERGWLSSNNIVFLEGEGASLVDSGYVSHAPQTVELVRHALQGRTLRRLVNTHSHSDHIGGNAALKAAFGCRIAIPQAMEPMVAPSFDEAALMLADTDQRADPFAHDEVISAGDEIELGGLVWRALSAPGHDDTHLVFHCEQKRLLISGDVLWREGFGVVFSALAGDEEGFAATRRSLELVSRLPLDAVIPGHGAPFEDVDEALARAFSRIEAFSRDPERHARHAARVLFTFALLEKREMPLDEVASYLSAVPLIGRLNDRYFRQSSEALADWLLRDLERAGALSRTGDRRVVAAGGA